MRLEGVELKPQDVLVVLPRDTGDIPFHFKAVLDYSSFEAMCPEPEAPDMLFPGGVKGKNENDPDYLKRRKDWAGYRTNWMMLESFKATPGLVWDTVDMADPTTWGNFDKELRAVFPEYEVTRLLNGVLEACGFNQGKIDEAKKRFLVGQVKQFEPKFTQNTDSPST